MLRLLAAQLLTLIKWDSLLQHEQDLLNKLATDGQGDEIYDWILAAVDITKGKPQDKIRKAYESIKVAATDNPVQLSIVAEAEARGIREEKCCVDNDERTKHRPTYVTTAVVAQVQLSALYCHASGAVNVPK